MAGVEIGDFGSPDETRTPDKATIEIVHLSGASASRSASNPAGDGRSASSPSRAANAARPTTSSSCSRERWGVVHEDGTEEEIRAGQGIRDRARAHAWVIGSPSNDNGMEEAILASIAAGNPALALPLPPVGTPGKGEGGEFCANG